MNKEDRTRQIIKLLYIGSAVLVSLVVIHVVAVIYDLGGLYGGMPSLEKLANPKSEVASEVYSADNELLGKYFKENRSPVTYEQISPNVIKTLYATEDVRFDEHSGIDLKGLSSIGYYMLIGKRRGSSTITQQLAKNLFDTRGDLYDGPFTKLPILGTTIIKTKEWVTAISLERSYTKEEILVMYLNTVNFGSNAFGIKTAARTFFNTTPDKLSLPQSAVLIGALKAQTLYSPVYNPERAIKRRNTVLDQLAKYNFISDEESEGLKLLPIKLAYNVENPNDGYATYFRAEIRKDLLGFCRDNHYDLFSDGLKVYTTIDSRLQRYAEAAVTKHMVYQQDKFFKYWGKRYPWVNEEGKLIPNFIENAAKKSSTYQMYLAQFDGDVDSTEMAMKRKIKMRVFTWNGDKDTLMSPMDSIRYYKYFLHCGLMSMDPHTGNIKAWVGGINFKHFKYDHVKQGKRQPGSSFKPVLYCAAIDNGRTPCTKILDRPVTIYNPETKTSWTPQNSDGYYSGEYLTLRQAIARSINSVAVDLIQQLGPQKVVEYAKRLGIMSKLDPVPALALGAADVSLYELVGAYSVFANKGQWTKPYYITRIEDKTGHVLRKFNPEKRDAINEETAYIMLYMMQGATREKNGTALGLYRLGKTLNGNEIAAKTGTTSNYSDGWFVGIAKDLITGVWVGGDDRSIHFHSSNDGQGARMAMPIWSYYMDAAYADKTTGIVKGLFEKPERLSIELDCSKAELGEDSTTIDNKNGGALDDQL